jgi:glyoxylase-like metal-dependent hydrolase (beta-lactamase superfamily II)
MHDVIRKASIAIVLGLGTNAGAGPAANPMDEVKIEVVPVAERIVMLTGRGGNIGVSFGDDGVILIDDQYAPLTPKIRAALAMLSDKPLRFVINTHWHGDHTGGNENLGRQGALIVAAPGVRRRMAAGGFMEAFKREVAPAPAVALPVVTFDGQVTFHLNGYDIEAINLPPAHTDGDSVVIFKGANVVHMGDLYFNGLYPVIDWGSGGHIDGMIAAIDHVLPLLDDKSAVIPGHGPLSNKAELAAYREMLATVAPRFKKAIKQGKTVEQVKALKLTADFDEKWGQGFMKPEPWAEAVYQGLVRQRGKSWK